MVCTSQMPVIMAHYPTPLETDQMRTSSHFLLHIRCYDLLFAVSFYDLILSSRLRQRSSDLSFELFVAAVLKHNAQVDGVDAVEDAADASPLQPQRSPFSEPVLHNDDPEEPLVRHSVCTFMRMYDTTIKLY